MKKIPVSLRGAAIVVFVSTSFTVTVAGADAVPVLGGTTRIVTATTAEVAAKSSNTSTSITISASAPATPSTPKGLITAGSSRSECLAPETPSGNYGLSYLQSVVAKFNRVTKSTVSCISSYLNGAQTWAQWEHPWIANSKYGYTSWVGEKSQRRQLVLAVNLIPNSLENVSNPLTWEQSCAAGDFNSYATTLGTSLVTAGLENSVIRLGPEMNGVWEADFIGNSKVEQRLWSLCFANEVTSLRHATGEHFLIDWNPNACKGNFPYANYYPGNAYVDILGFDLFDVGCETPTTPLSFSRLASEPAGLKRFEAFATAQGKPMSFPEWGLSTIPSGDDPKYVDGIGSTVAKRNFAFQTYFDATSANSKALPLGPRTPLSLAAYQKWFGKGSRH